MRLLKLRDGKLSLTEFVGAHIPRYAILSHTWGKDDEEVTFKDIVKGTGASKDGYNKILFCGKQATKDSLHYFWVDTCCIDKSSSAELSEAINSMFRWYSDAAKCYVYLSDVSINSSVGSDLSSQQAWKQAFKQSRWFTRGWTIQELLAPKSVEFFSAEGERLGDKISLLQEIRNATQISLQALQGSPLSQFSVDERISWAERRETKREEDAAYSLLGIFEVHIPLIYGEGRERAFKRLRAEIDEQQRAPVKNWDLAFSNEKRLDEDEPFAEFKKTINALGEGIDFFLKDTEDSSYHVDVEEISWACRDARLDHLVNGVGSARERQSAWVDDRMRRNGSVRNYKDVPGPSEQWHSATELYDLLQKPRFGLSEMPDADRRLIYVRNLDPYYILALCATVPFYQRPALIDAVWQHIALQTSIRIKIPPKAFPVFQLQLQIPYFVLRPLPKKPNNSKIRRQWIDLSFLQMPPYRRRGGSKYGVFEAEFSLVLCGKHDSRWVAYAFDDTYFNEEDDDEEDEEGEEGEEGEEDEEDEEDPQALEDPIANGKLIADPPLWNARDYFFTICNFRMTQVFQELQSLVRTIQHSIRACAQHSEDRQPPANKIKETLEQNVKTIKLLTQLHACISRIIKSWENFYSHDGDIGYYHDFDVRSQDQSSRLVRGSLNGIRETLAKLKSLEQDALILKESCFGSADALKLRLALEGAEEARRSNEAAQDCTKVAEESQKPTQEFDEVARKIRQIEAFVIWVLSPMIMLLALCQLPQDVVPFKQSSVIPFVTTLVLMAALNGTLPCSLWSWKDGLALFTAALSLAAEYGALLHPYWWSKKIHTWRARRGSDC